MDDVHRHHVAPRWHWRYLRGIQCVLLATRGLVSPNLEFVRNSFGETYEEFLEILTMPDRYIIYREHYRNDGAADWRRSYARLDADQRGRLLDALHELNASPHDRSERIAGLDRPLRRMMEYYYPGGRIAPRTPKDEELAQQGVSVGYDSGPG